MRTRAIEWYGAGGVFYWPHRLISKFWDLEISSVRLRCQSTSNGSDRLAPSRSLPSTSHCQVPPGSRTCPEWDAFPSPGSFPRTPEPLAQGPISLLTLEKQYLHPRALWQPLTSRPPSLSIILYSSFQTIQYSLGYSYYYQVAGIVKVGVVRSLAFIPFFCITIHVYKLLIMLLAFINSKQGGKPFLTLCKW